ncbi:TPA: hypothetical protein ACSVZR_003545 [Bacillus cereus]
MKEKTFVVRFEGDMDADQLDSVIFRGLQWYENIEWETYSAKEVETND